MNENCFSRDNPAMNEHHYHITRKQYNQDFTTRNIYNVDKSKYNKKSYHKFSDIQFNTKKQFITNGMSKYITKRNSITNNEHVLILKRFFCE